MDTCYLSSLELSVLYWLRRPLPLSNSWGTFFFSALQLSTSIWPVKDYNRAYFQHDQLDVQLPLTITGLTLQSLPPQIRPFPLWATDGFSTMAHYLLAWLCCQKWNIKLFMDGERCISHHGLFSAIFFVYLVRGGFFFFFLITQDDKLEMVVSSLGMEMDILSFQLLFSEGHRSPRWCCISHKE